ncbi:hypothetical protein [Agromyces humi]|uniref:hypothetical protein n=1 Tax=Agromyces humi TaxID=1766800 RepID=UPI00135A96BC|nr:hypothetical protein [Agromyces humi]
MAERVVRAGLPTEIAELTAQLADITRRAPDQVGADRLIEELAPDLLGRLSEIQEQLGYATLHVADWFRVGSPSIQHGVTTAAAQVALAAATLRSAAESAASTPQVEPAGV